jgi:hypothetical protein
VDGEGFAFGGESAICDFLVLLLEEGAEAGAVTPTIGFGPDADTVVVRLVEGEFLEPGLGEVPERAGGVFGVVGCVELGLGGECSDVECIILLRNAVGEVCYSYILGELIIRP